MGGIGSRCREFITVTRHAMYFTYRALGTLVYISYTSHCCSSPLPTTLNPCPTSFPYPHLPRISHVPTSPDSHLEHIVRPFEPSSLPIICAHSSSDLQNINILFSPCLTVLPVSKHAGFGIRDLRSRRLRQAQRPGRTPRRKLLQRFAGRHLAQIRVFLPQEDRGRHPRLILPCIGSGDRKSVV